MFKSTSAVLAIFVLAALFVPSMPAIAQEEGASTSATSGSGILPDSNFYFVKVLGRNLQLWLADDVKKANLLLQFSSEDALVIEELSQNGKFDLALQHTEQFQQQLQRAVQHMERAQAQGQDVRVLVMKLEQNHLRQQAVLARVLEKAPEAAQEGLLNAIENSSKHVGDAILAVEGQEAMNSYREHLDQQVSNMGEDTKLRVRERLQAVHGKPVNVTTKPEATEASTVSPVPIPVQNSTQAGFQNTSVTTVGSQQDIQEQTTQQIGSSGGQKQQTVPQQGIQSGNQGGQVGNPGNTGNQHNGSK